MGFSLRQFGFFSIGASLLLVSWFTFLSISLTGASHLFLFLGLVCLLLDSKGKKLNFQNIPPSSLALFGFGVICILSVLVSPLELNTRALLKARYYILGAFAPYVLKSYIDHIKSKRPLSVFLWGMLVSAGLATVSGMIGLWSGFNPLKMKEACHHSRSCGMYGTYMTYGYAMGLWSTLLLGLSLFKTRMERFIPKWCLILSAFLGLVGLFFSYCRGAWIGFFVSLPALFLFKSKKIMMAMILVPLILCVAVFVNSEKIQQTFLSKQRQESNSIRIAQYKAAWETFKEKPVLGIGFLNFRKYSGSIKERFHIPHKDFEDHAHSNYFEHLATTGILGLLSLFLFHLLWARESIKRKDHLGHIAFAFNVNFMVSGLFQYTIGDGENLFLLLAFYAVSTALTPNEDFSEA